MVPYSQILVQEQIQIIKNFQKHISQASIMDNNCNIDENNISSIIRQYRKYWQKYIFLKNFPLTINLIPLCFFHLKKQFMQNKSTPNILFFKST